MSEDEAIKILRDIPFFEQVENHDVNGPKWILKTNKRLVQARDMVLDLYKKEKEKNEELLKDNNALNRLVYFNKSITFPYETELTSTNGFVSKDKIREKIKELENLIETNSLYEECWNKIEVLKDLLEEN